MSDTRPTRPSYVNPRFRDPVDLVDGTVYAYQASPHEGLVYVTVAGPDEDRPMIVCFDRADLDTLNMARKELRDARRKRNTEPDPGSVLAILQAARGDHFVHDRVEYRRDHRTGEWVAWGRTDIDEVDQ